MTDPNIISDMARVSGMVANEGLHRNEVDVDLTPEQVGTLMDGHLPMLFPIKGIGLVIFTEEDTHIKPTSEDEAKPGTIISGGVVRGSRVQTYVELMVPDESKDAHFIRGAIARARGKNPEQIYPSKATLISSPK
jgi:hypothetical protein